MKIKRELFVLFALSFLLVIGCSEKFIEQSSGFEVEFNELKSGTINEEFLVGEDPEYDIYDSSNLLYFNKEDNFHKCNKFDDKAKEINIFESGKLGGASRLAYYCESENVYYIKDFPGLPGLHVYGPFVGYPK